MNFHPRFSVLMTTAFVVAVAPFAHAGELRVFPPVVEGSTTICAPTANARTPLTWDGQSDVACAEGITMSGGRVGIEIASPANALDVNGSAAFGTYAGTATGARDEVIIGGNVGIGTQTPGWMGAALQVEGNITSEGDNPFAFSVHNLAGGPDQTIWVPMQAVGNELRSYIANDANNESSIYEIVARNGNSISGISFPTGPVGIGTMTPGWMGATLQVEGNITSEGDNPFAFTIHNLAGGANQTIWVPLQAVGNELRSYIANDANNASVIYQMVTRSGNSISSIVFPAGKVGIGNTNPSYVLDVTGQARFTGNYTTSDRRLKTNIADIGYGLDDVMKLHPVFFDWKKPVKGEEGRRVGFIAQEIKDVIPEVVSIAPDEMKTEAVEYGNVTPILVKAIQQLKIENDDLRAHVAADDAEAAKIKALTSRVDALEAAHR